MLGACDEAAAMAAWAVSTAIWRKPCASSAATIRLRTAGSSSTTKMSGFAAEFGTALLLIKRNIGGGKLNRKDRTVWIRRGNLYATAMCQHNGAAQG